MPLRVAASSVCPNPPATHSWCGGDAACPSPLLPSGSTSTLVVDVCRDQSNCTFSFTDTDFAATTVIVGQYTPPSPSDCSLQVTVSVPQAPPLSNPSVDFVLSASHTGVFNPYINNGIMNCGQQFGTMCTFSIDYNPFWDGVKDLDLTTGVNVEFFNLTLSALFLSESPLLCPLGGWHCQHHSRMPLMGARLQPTLPCLADGRHAFEVQVSLQSGNDHCTKEINVNEIVHILIIVGIVLGCT